MSNLYRAFRALAPAAPLQVGTVVALEGPGRVVIELPGGHRIVARGNVTSAGSKVFVRGGVVEGEAPNLTYVEIDI